MLQGDLCYLFEKFSTFHCFLLKKGDADCAVELSPLHVLHVSVVSNI